MHSPAMIYLAAILLLGTSLQANALEAGDKAPNCTLASDRSRLDFQQFRGKVLYVDFWASWCGPCAQSFPFMNTLDRQLKDQGLQVVGVNLDEQPEDAKAFLTARPARFEIGADGDRSCAQRFGVTAMPSSFLIDRKGIVRYVHRGFRPGEAGKLRTVVEQLLAEGPAPR